jgi:hypothetical protein
MWKLEDRRTETLSVISRERRDVELMAQRPRRSSDVVDGSLLDAVLKALKDIEDAATLARNTTQLGDLTDAAELQGVFAAYLCPETGVKDEGTILLDQIAGWGIPKSAIAVLRESVAKKLDSADASESRSALYTLFVERVLWDDYIDEYEETMQGHTRWLFGSTVVVLLLAAWTLSFAASYPFLLWLGILLAGAAGSCVSVMTKMPALDLSLSGELDAYGRRIMSRIAVGIVASGIGCGLLNWGALPISIQNLTFKDALNGCVVSPDPSGTGPKILIVLAVAMLLGFSERTLASFEQRVFGSPKSTRG